VVFNTVVLKQLGYKGFDPYPYILLNLALSMMAGLQYSRRTETTSLISLPPSPIETSG
jgi:hypothetical protein